MRRNRSILGFFGFMSCLLGTNVAEAHHSFSAQYDADKTATIEGLVIKVEWSNPHVYFFMDVVDADGNTVEWGLEMSNTVALARQGWSKDTLNVGDVVEVEGALARDGSRLLNVSTVTLADSGKRLYGRD